MRIIKSFFEKLVLPVSQNEDRARVEFILNVLLVAIIGLAFIAFAINLIKEFLGVDNPISAGFIFIILSFFCFPLFFIPQRFFSAQFLWFINHFFLARYLSGLYLWSGHSVGITGLRIDHYYVGSAH